MRACSCRQNSVWRAVASALRRRSASVAESEQGDTLVEVLIALVVISLTAVAVLGAFVTSISATTEQRTLASADSVLRSFVETATYDIRLAPTPAFVACATASSYNSIASTYTSTVAPTGYTVTLSVTKNLATPCTTSKPSPQQLLAKVTSTRGANDSLSFIVSQPNASSAPITTTITQISPTFGPAAGGTLITISGAGFTGATNVTFGTVAATSFTVVSDNTITATSPQETLSNTVYNPNVSVTTPSGTSVSDAQDQYTYGPQVGAVSPATGPPYGGTVVTITGTGFTAGDTVAFGANAGTGVTFSSSTSINVTAPASTLAGDGVGTVDVTVTTVSGTSPATSADHYTYGLSVTAVNPATGPTTGGTVVTITGSGFGAPGATDVVDFGATPASAVTVVSDSSITATSPAGSGVVDVTVTASGSTSPVNKPADQFTYTAVSVVAGLGIQLKTGTGGVLSCGAIKASDTCAITGVGKGGSATYFVEFLNSSGQPVVFSTTTNSTINDDNGSPNSVVILANMPTSSPNAITQSHNGNSTSTNKLTFNSGPTSFTLTVTVDS